MNTPNARPTINSFAPNTSGFRGINSDLFYVQKRLIFLIFARDSY